MKIFLTDRVESITGELGKGFGYHIQHRKNGFYVKRNTKGHVPPDGHWRIIRTCAEMTKGHLHIADISVKKEELYDALTEANHWIAARSLRLPLYNARDIINLKITFSL